jgi:hypothetical protein
MGLSNEAVAIIFASKNLRDVKGNNVFIEGKTIYSYGHHFPIATWLADGKVAFNKDKYSTTTAKHKSIVGRYISVSVESIFCSTEELKQIVGRNESTGAVVQLLFRDKELPTDLDVFANWMRRFLQAQGLSAQKARAMVKKVEEDWRRQMLVKAL